jgi:hypothetical protein
VSLAEILPLEPRSGENLDELGSRLSYAADRLRLKPVEGPAEIADRLHEVVREIESIRGSIRLMLHLAELADSDFEAKVAEFNAQLENDDWQPVGAPVDEVVARLRDACPD